MTLPQPEIKPVGVLCAPKSRVVPSAVILVALVAGTAKAQTLQGTATYRERMVLPSAAVFEAVLEDVSRGDAPAETIARTRVPSPGNLIAFAIPYDPRRILATHRYGVRARILLNEQPLFTTDTVTHVITGGSPTKVSLVLRRVPGPLPRPGAVPGWPLEGTYWKAIELAGKPTPPPDANREVHLQFQDGRVSGSDGCNQFTGTYQLNGERIMFGQMAGTLMACLNPSGTEDAFRKMLKNASRLTVAGDRLELLDAAGTRLAAFTAGPKPSASLPVTGFAGTSWQLVKFQSSDDTTLTPDDRAKYTIEFAAGGQLIARIDCNRGHGTWKTTGPSHIKFGPLALTRAQCPPGSLHDHIVKQWGNIRSYVIRDGHLFLALLADGGIYEFEPSSPHPVSK